MMTLKEKYISLLVNLQKDCAPVTIQIGSVNESNQVLHDTIIIKDACTSVVYATVKFAEENFLMCDITSDGLRLCFYTPKKIV